MSVIVISCGRTGTNMALSILEGNNFFTLDSLIENKKIFTNIKKYNNNNYLAKTDITYLPKYEYLVKLMNLNENMKMIWTIRDPRDVIMSKIRRGQSKNNGGDNPTNNVFFDGTPIGSEQGLRKMYNTYKKCLKDFPERTFLIKMETMIEDTEKASKDMCKFIGIEYKSNMINFPERMKIPYKIKRYGKKIDVNQVGLWKNWKREYDGFFTKNNYDLEKIFNNINDLIIYFNYDDK